MNVICAHVQSSDRPARVLCVLADSVVDDCSFGITHHKRFVRERACAALA